MKITKLVIHFIWLLPESKDNNRQIRQMIISEANYCKNLDIRFYSGEFYQTQTDFDKYPDLVILFGSFYEPVIDIYNLVYKVKSTANTYIAAWTTDDPYEFDCNYFLPKLFDFVFSNDKNSCNYYHCENNVWHLPLAASEEMHGKLEASKHPDWDFVFCGVGFPNRTDIIEGLLDVLKNYSTLIIGSGWSSKISSSLTVRDSINYSELLSIYRNTKIVLNLSRAFDLKNQIYEIIPSTPAPRTFEVAAMGVFQMIFLDRPEIYEYFDRNEIISFSSQTDFLKLSKKYLENFNLRSDIAIRSRQRVFKEHLYRHRLETIARLVFSNSNSDQISI